MRKKLSKITAVVIVIFMNVVQVVGQPLLDIHSGNLTAAIIVYMTAASSAASWFLQNK